MTKPPEADPGFAALEERFLAEDDVEPGTGFGSVPGLRVRGKIFAMLSHAKLVVKLPSDRCAAMVESGQGRLFVIGRRTMREWLAVAKVDVDAWVALAAEALVYVRK